MRVLLLIICLLSCAGSDRAQVSSLCEIGGEAPRTIQDVVDRIQMLDDAIEEPVTLECFVASLPRPLDLVASYSTFSAQPSPDRAHPRVFLFTDEGFILSIVLGGDGAHLLEMSEFTSTTRSIKGEIPFPIEAPITNDAPYEEILFDESMTGCAFCHGGEVEVDGRPGAYESDAIRPTFREIISLESMERTHASCDDEVDPLGCILLHALLDFGEVRETEFNEEIRTFL